MEFSMFGHSRQSPLLRIGLCVLLGIGLSMPGYAQTSDTEAGATQEQPDQSGDSAYEFGPMDEIKLRVVAWDNDALQFRSVDVVSGTYAVGTDGRMMLPIIGNVAASGSVQHIAFVSGGGDHERVG